jgi:Trk-type K+ transport system membrane component
MMPTNWQFWLNIGSVAFGLLVIVLAARAKRDLRRRPLDPQRRQLVILLGICICLMSLAMALVTSGRRFPFDSAVEYILLLIAIVLLATVINVAAHRRNYARAIAAQNAQNSQEANEEVR